MSNPRHSKTPSQLPNSCSHGTLGKQSAACTHQVAGAPFEECFHAPRTMPLSYWLLHSWHIICADQKGPSTASHHKSLYYYGKLVNRKFIVNSVYTQLPIGSVLIGLDTVRHGPQSQSADSDVSCHHIPAACKNTGGFLHIPWQLHWCKSGRQHGFLHSPHTSQLAARRNAIVHALVCILQRGRQALIQASVGLRQAADNPFGQA